MMMLPRGTLRLASRSIHGTASRSRLLSPVVAPQVGDSEDKTREELRTRDFHATAAPRQSEAAAEFPSTTTTTTSSFASGLYKRFVVTAEVTVSKIFPAGFCWQTGGVLATGWGYAPDSFNFALSTGVGDALGVCFGHCLYYASKKSLLQDAGINMKQELHTGLLLGSAAFCSGTAWQPLVNALQGANLPFSQVFLGTWIGCGVAFYGGLRVGRTFLSGALEYVDEPTYANSKTDASLSTAIGGATGFFVGTDAAYLPEQNFLIHMVGIQDGTSDVVGCALAGSATSLGFLTAQTTLNLIYPKTKCWND